MTAHDSVHGVRVLMFPSAYAHGTIGATVRALSIARALRARGCAVAFVAVGYSAAMIQEDGFPTYPCPAPTAAGTSVPIRSGMDGLIWTGLSDRDFVIALVRAELAAIEAFQPEVAWAEFRPTASISCIASGVPLASIANWPTHPRFPGNQAPDPGADGYNAALRSLGQAPVRSSIELVFMRSALALAPTLPELEPELASTQPDVVFIGHTIDRSSVSPLPEWFDDWAGPDPGFAYLSVTGLQPGLYADILTSAYRGTRFRVLCATGFLPSMDTVPPDSPEVRFTRFVPAMPVIQRSRFVVYTGGHDTMLSALYHGVPSIAIPGAVAECAYNAQTVAGLGAGITLPITAFRPRRLRTLTEVVLDPTYAEAAERIGRRLRAAGGCEEAADRMIALAGAGPVPTAHPDQEEPARR